MKKCKPATINYNNSAVHILLLALVTLAVFVLPAALRTTAPLNEALFFMALKDGATLPYPALTIRLYETLIGNGTSLLALRLFAAAATFIVLLGVYGSAKKLYDLSTAFLAALVLVTMPLFAQLAVNGLPCMWVAALIGLPVLLWFAGSGPPSWRRWLLIWICAVAALACGGLSALYSILIFVAGNFLLTADKKQRLRRRGTLIPLILFIATLAWLALWPPLGLESWFSRSALIQSVSGVMHLANPALWIQIPRTLLNSLSVWLLACAVIIVCRLVMALQRKALNAPHQKQLALWFVAALLPILLANFDEPGRFVAVLPPVAVWIAFFMNSYACHKITLPKARITMQADAAILKLMLAGWGLLLCLLALYLLFNLEQAWRRGFYLETQGLALLGGGGVVLILLAFRAFWIKSQTYTLWGFLLVMLLSFGFVYNAVLKPANDLLHTPRYFNQNLTALFPEIRWQGVIVGVNRVSRPDILKARYFLYADFPVHMRPVSADAFLLSQREALPQRLILDDDILAALGAAPFKAGYAPVYWEEVDGLLLTMLELQAIPADAPKETLPPLTLAAKADAGADDLWASGYCLAGGYLIPYESVADAIPTPTGIRRFPDRQLQIFSVNSGEGLRSAYTLHWLLTAGPRYPQRYTGLELYNQTAYLNKQRPYGYRFQRWALSMLRTALKPDFVAFSGLNPQHQRTRRILNRLLAADPMKQAAIATPVSGITVERAGAHTFLRFRNNDSYILSLELRPTF